MFFQGYASDYQALDAFAADIQRTVQYERVSYRSLAELLRVLVKKLQRFETVSLMDGQHCISLCNYSSLLQQIEQLTIRLKQSGGGERRGKLEELTDLLSGITDIDFLAILVTSMLIKHSLLLSDVATPSYINKFLTSIKKCEKAEDLRGLLLSQLDALFAENPAAQPEYKDCVARILQYVDHNLDNPQLSLKWLAENQLFMNVDYLSKQFTRQTGERFSAYLTRKRIDTAKALLSSCETDRICDVAEAVGCGNNPQYFSQIFKRAVGMTPSEYSKSAAD